ncbi:MAG: hypothetical protein VCA35_17070, partial [Roseibacillus sp.]
ARHLLRRIREGELETMDFFRVRFRHGGSIDEIYFDAVPPALTVGDKGQGNRCTFCRYSGGVHLFV